MSVAGCIFRPDHKSKALPLASKPPGWERFRALPEGRPGVSTTNPTVIWTFSGQGFIVKLRALNVWVFAVLRDFTRGPKNPVPLQ